MVDEVVNLDLSPAFAALDDLVARLTASVAEGAANVAAALQDAVGSVDPTIDVTVADASAITDEIADAVAAVDGEVDVQLGDASEVTDAISDAVAAADGEVDVELADPDALTGAIEDAVAAADTTVTVNTNSSGGGGTKEAASDFLSLASATNIAKGAAAGAKGEMQGLAGATQGLAGSAGVAVGGVTAVLAVLGEMVNKAAFSQSATFQLTNALGDLADEVETIDVGGLNESLNSLAVRLGGDDDAIRVVIANLSLLGQQSGKTGPEIVALDKEFIALAAHVAATHPQLGTTDQILQKLPLALSRGGRFAAGFGISLTQADLAAEAVTEGITKQISEMSIYEKAALGVTLVNRRLGDSLAVDVNKGADTAIIKLRVFRERITETFESAGAPLLGTVTKLGTDIGPVIDGLIGTIGRVGAGVAEFLEPILRQLGPSLGDIFGTVNDIIEPLIPLLGLLGKAFGLVLTPVSLLLGQIRRLADYVHDNVPEAFRAMERAAVGAILPIIDAINHMIEAFNKIPVVGNIGTIDTTGLKNLGQEQTTTAAAAEELAAAQGDATEALDAATTAAADAANQFGGQMFSDLATGVQLFNGEILKTRGLADQAFSVVLKLGDRARPAIDLLVKSFDKGGLSATEFQNVASGLGLSLAELATLEGKAREEADAFAQSVEKSLGNVTQAAGNLDDQGKAHIKSFVSEIQKQALDAAAFTNSIQTLFERGATQLAQTLLAAGPAAAGAAREAAKSSDVQLAAQENAIQTSQRSYTEQAAALETYKGQVIDKTSKIVDAFGNLAPKPTDVQTGIDEALLGAQNAIDAKQTQVSDTAHAVGAAIAAGLAAGIQQGQAEVNRVISETVDGALLAAQAAGEIKSPSRLFSREVGIPIDEGIANGIRAGFFKVDDAMGEVIAGLQQQAKQELDNVFSVLQAGQSFQNAQDTLNDAQTRRADLIAQNGQLGSQIKSLRAEVTAEQARSSAVTAREQQAIDRAQQALVDLQHQAADQAKLPQDIAAAQRELALSASDLGDLSARLAEAQAGAALGTVDDKTVSDLRSKVSDRQREADDAQRALDQLTAKQDDAKVSSVDLQVAQEDLAQARADAVAPTQALIDLQEQLKQAQTDQKQVQDDLQQSTKDITNAQLGLLSAYEQAAVAGQAFYDQGGRGQDILKAIGDQAGISAGALQGLIDKFANFSVQLSQGIGGSGAGNGVALTGPNAGRIDVFGDGKTFVDTPQQAIDARNYVRGQAGDPFREPAYQGTANFNIFNQDPAAVAFAVQSKLGIAAVRG